MSGLAILLHRDGRPVDRCDISSMLAAAPYRGPDGMFVRTWGSLGLGHARMALTLEEESEEQPLVSPRTGCAIVADVRLDNREELMARLGRSLGERLSDADIILRAYEEWGVDALRRLLGDFAFAIWDPRCQSLVCARDAMGQRALFYRCDHFTFAAASEIQQLLQDPAVPIAPSEERIRDFLTPLNGLRNERDHPLTFYEGIYSLPAGHVMTVGSSGVKTRRYWEMDPPAELRYRSSDEYAEHYRALLLEVVRARLRSSRPIEALLSGGLDSSSIVCVAQELYRAGAAPDRGFASISVTYEGYDCDETHFIREVRAKYGFEAHYVTCGDLAGRLQPDPRGFQEAPNVGVSEVRDAIGDTATRAGIRVLLRGDLADNCVGGSRLVFDSLLRRGRFLALARQLGAYEGVSPESLRRIVAVYCLGPLLPLGLQKRLLAADARRSFDRRRGRLLPYWMPKSLQEEMEERELRLRLSAIERRRFTSPAHEGIYQSLYPPEVARHPAPWPVQLVRPFADRRLHEFLLSVPPEELFEPHPETDDFYAGAKRLVRRGLRDMLPESIRTRTSRTNFSGMFEAEVRRHWAVYEETFGPSTYSQIARRGYVDRDRFWDRLRRIHTPTQRQDNFYVAQLVGLETWLRTLTLPRWELVTMPAPWQLRGVAEQRHEGAGEEVTT